MEVKVLAVGRRMLLANPGNFTPIKKQKIG
jgi:hypothetical protein